MIPVCHFASTVSSPRKLVKLFCSIFIICSLLLGSLAQTAKIEQRSEKQPNQLPSEDLVQIHELPSTVGWSGAKQSDLAPESRVVGVYFDKVVLNIAQDAIRIDRTKQSQEFDVSATPAGVSVAPTEISPITSDQSVQTTEAPISSEMPTSASSEAPTTTEPATTTSSSEDAPVASKTSRQGAAVFCGEANPNGKSNRRLVKDMGPKDRIVGGSKTEPGEFPFQVRLNIRSRRGSGICGGVILDEQHILTAAHCMTACVSQHLTTATIENTGVHATIGDHSIRSNDGEVEVDINKITPHEKYDACNFYANDHDIALIKTSTPIEYRFTTDGYGSINRPCMPNTNQTYREGESVIVSGWGVTRENSGSLSNILRYVQVPVVTTSKCQETYGSRVTNDHICAGFQSGGKDSCQGDSGGPLVRVVDNRYELVGIVSFGYGCGQPGAPGVYTRVASYIEWIQSNL